MLIAELVLLFLAALVSQAFAENDVIYACYGTSKSVKPRIRDDSGANYLRIVSDPSECKKGEKSITLCTKCGGTDSGYKYRVYDANNQYLGLSNSKSPISGGSIFIPSLDMETSIISYKCKLGRIYGHSLYFEGTDCTGKMYAQLSPGMLYQYGDGSEAIFFKSIGDGQYLDDIVKSSYHILNGCQNYVPECSFGYETEQIPSSSIPFTLPVALPLHYENND